MYSGKTSALIAMAKSHMVAGNTVDIYKPNIDNRYSENFIASHNGEKLRAKVLDIKRPRSILTEEISDVVCFEEAQFFNKYELWALVEQLIYLENKIVIVAGLCQDFEGRPFGCMPQLLSFADNIIHLKSVCSKCRQLSSATRTYKKSNKTQNVEIGGIELYEARCFTCWRE